MNQYLILQDVRPVQHDIQPQQHTSILQAVDAAMNEAHWLFQREYQRQLQMYQAYNGRPPYYHYEFASVAEHARAALPQAVRAYLR